MRIIKEITYRNITKKTEPFKIDNIVQMHYSPEIIGKVIDVISMDMVKVKWTSGGEDSINTLRLDKVR